MQKNAVHAIQDHNGWVGYDYQFVDAEFDPKAESWVPGWLRQSLGDDFFHAVEEVSFFSQFQENGALVVNQTPDVLPLQLVLAGVTKIKCLRLWGTQVTDRNLKVVADLNDLEDLVIVDAISVSDKGVAHMRSLNRLKWLVLTESQITDESLRVVGKLPNLEVLNIQASRLSDEGLLHLSDHKKLRTLFVHGDDDQPNS